MLGFSLYKINEINKELTASEEIKEELVELVEIPEIPSEEPSFKIDFTELKKISEIFNIYPYELYMFEHLRPADELKKELFSALDENEKLLRLVYKFYRTIK